MTQAHDLFSSKNLVTLPTTHPCFSCNALPAFLSLLRRSRLKTLQSLRSSGGGRLHVISTCSSTVGSRALVHPSPSTTLRPRLPLRVAGGKIFVIELAPHAENLDSFRVAGSTRKSYFTAGTPLGRLPFSMILHGSLMLRENPKPALRLAIDTRRDFHRLCMGEGRFGADRESVFKLH